MKKLGKRLYLTNETLRAYCGCDCKTTCSIKCGCTPSSGVTSALYNTNASNVYSTTGTTAR